MAKVSNPLIGRSSGKIGSVIMQTYKGLNIIREKPLTVANPQTEAQMSNRARLRFLVALYRAYSAIFALGFRQAQNPLSPYNWFISNNNNAGFLDWNGTTVVPDYSALKAAKGTMEETQPSTAVYNNVTGAILLNYPIGIVGTQQKTTDQLNIVVANTNTKEIIKAETTTASRSSGSYNIVGVGTGLDPDDLIVLSFFTSVDNKNTSDSVITLVS